MFHGASDSHCSAQESIERWVSEEFFYYSLLAEGTVLEGYLISHSLV